MARAKREKKKAEEAAKARAEKAGKDGGSSSSASDKALVVAPDTGSGSGSSSGSGSGSGSDKKEGKESKENLVGVSQYATLFRVSSVRSKVLWATPAQIAEQLDSHKGDVDKTVKYLREHQSDYVSDPSEVELIEMFPSHSRDTISRILKSAGRYVYSYGKKQSYVCVEKVFTRTSSSDIWTSVLLRRYYRVLGELGRLTWSQSSSLSVLLHPLFLFSTFFSFLPSFFFPFPFFPTASTMLRWHCWTSSRTVTIHNIVLCGIHLMFRLPLCFSLVSVNKCSVTMTLVGVRV